MQSHLPLNATLTAPAENPGITSTTQSEPVGKSGRFAVTMRSGITSFFAVAGAGWIIGLSNVCFTTPSRQE